ncbi:hypothetical protein Tco_1026446 [Tanacetum coccineum]
MASTYGTNALSKFSPDIELVLYPLQDKLTSEDKSLDLSAFKLSRLFFSLLSLGSSSCWGSYGAQNMMAGPVEGGGPKGTDDREETLPPLTKEQIEGHVSALKSLIKSHNQRNKGDPIRLDFE